MVSPISNAIDAATHLEDVANSLYIVISRDEGAVLITQVLEFLGESLVDGD